MIKKNKLERDEDSLHHTDMFDSHMLWFLMHHLRQRRHHRVGAPLTPSSVPLPPRQTPPPPLFPPPRSQQRRREPGAPEADSDESPSSSDSSDEEEEGPDRVQCMPS